ncbi:hypothetical protein [Klebsiella oxytoca]|uniref:hypothetical protein n=1 Tax=Klebsiella oxytoca TaxID=571 RepID=UPI00189C0D2A|nr:hypothetical protein [Klebsiella oxytoca]HED4271367.1 hypothetical protein [Klebsiella oxytoca]
MSNSRSSRYVWGNVSFSAIAKMAPGQVVCLALNPDEKDALSEVSKSLKAAFSRAGRKCSLTSGTAAGEFTRRREGTATHLYVRVSETAPVGQGAKN